MKSGEIILKFGEIISTVRRNFLKSIGLAVCPLSKSGESIAFDMYIQFGLMRGGTPNELVYEKFGSWEKLMSSEKLSGFRRNYLNSSEKFLIRHRRDS